MYQIVAKRDFNKFYIFFLRVYKNGGWKGIFSLLIVFFSIILSYRFLLSDSKIKTKDNKDRPNVITNISTICTKRRHSHVYY